MSPSTAARRESCGADVHKRLTLVNILVEGEKNPPKSITLAKLTIQAALTAGKEILIHFRRLGIKTEM